mgnify:CR=1 FL=1
MIEDVRGVFSLSDFRCLHQRDGESIQKLLKGMDEKMAESIRTVSARMISNMRNWTMTKWSC